MNQAQKKIIYPIVIILFAVWVSVYEINMALERLGSFVNSQYDDSYITFRYSWNLLTGEGFRFNPGDNTNSASAPTFGLLLSALTALKLATMPALSNVVNAIALVGMNITLGIAALKMRNRLWEGLMGVGVATLITLQGYVLYWTFSGMETTSYLFLFTLVLAIPLTQNLSFFQWDKVTKTVFIASLILFATFRLEGAIISVVITAGLLVSDPVAWRNKVRSIKLLIIPLAVLASFFFFWLTYYGHLIPEPLRFKKLARAYNMDLPTTLVDLKGFVTEHNVFFALTTVAILYLIARMIWRKTADIRSTYLVFALIAVTAFMLNSPHSDSYRYDLIIFPPMAAVILLALNYSTSEFASNPLRIVSAVTIVAITLGGILYISKDSKQNLEMAAQGNSWWWYLQEARTDAGIWLENNTPKDSIILAGDLGALSFYNPSNTFIDSGGLTNQKLIDAVEKSGSYSDVIVSQNPTYVVDTERDGITGSETIFNAPQEFYVNGTYSECKFEDIFNKKLIKRFPESKEIATSGLYVGIYKIDLKTNISCGK